VAVNDTASTTGTVVADAVHGVLANDSDPDGDRLTVVTGGEIRRVSGPMDHAVAVGAQDLEI
jgi:hypothetical protein